MAIGRVSSTALQAIFYLVIAAFLETAVYGELSYLISVAGVFSIFFRFGLNHTVTIFQAKDDQNISNNINIFALILSGVAAIILIPFNIYVAILSFGLSIFVMNQYNLLGLQKFKTYMWLAILKGIILVSIPILLYFIIDIPGVLLGIALSNFITGFNFIKFINKNSFDFSILKNNFSIIFHNFGVDAATNLPRVIDKLLIAPLLGFTLVGFYQFNIQILFGLELLPIALHSFLLSAESKGRQTKKIILFGIALTLLIICLGILFAPFLIDTFIPKFNDGVPSLQILIISLLPLSISAILNAKLQSVNSTKIGFSAIVRIGFLLTFILLFGSQYELMGLSIAVLGSTICYTVFLVILYSRIKVKN